LQSLRGPARAKTDCLRSQGSTTPSGGLTAQAASGVPDARSPGLLQPSAFPSIAPSIAALSAPETTSAAAASTSALVDRSPSSGGTTSRTSS
jgi:hypothetical protein